MKTFIKSLSVGFIIAMIFTLLPFEGECREISEQVFRVHILANSDSEEDQQLKLKVRDALIKKGEKLFANVHSKEEAKHTVIDNMDGLLSVAQKVIRSEGYDYSVSAAVKELYFDTRYYDEVTMPGGVYEALQIKIGSGEGKNWWCVMYPSLCLYAASESDTLSEQLTPRQYTIVSSDGQYEFRFRIVEVFSRICEHLSR
ncbi:MAG: stage II sporulation protein R [Clostridia bacterium]|nr:stage II sporulation protein R [Clostridia bacterium]